MKTEIIQLQVNIPGRDIESYVLANYKDGCALWSYKGLDYLYLTDTKLINGVTHSMSINIKDEFPSGFTINSIDDFNQWIKEDKEYQEDSKKTRTNMAVA